MTELLKKALNAVEQLPVEEQDRFAKLILMEITSESKWERLFADSQNVLAQLAREALSEYHEGKTDILDTDKL
jgi:hypothetical protein